MLYEKRDKYLYGGACATLMVTVSSCQIPRGEIIYCRLQITIFQKFVDLDISVGNGVCAPVRIAPSSEKKNRGVTTGKKSSYH